MIDRASFEDYVKAKRVFILGAGFSAQAGVPLTPELLKKAMAKFRAECPGIYSRVNRYARVSTGASCSEVDYSVMSFSDVCTYLEYVELREYGGGERWSDAGSREKLALRFFLSKTLVEHTPDEDSVPTVYLEFAAQLHPGDVVISFNWDCLLEVALDRLGKPYTYNFSDATAIKLCKLHGSVNWRLGAPNSLGKPTNTLAWESLRFTERMMTEEVFATPALLRFDTWQYYEPLGEVEPFLVLPGYGKAFDVRSLAPLWYKPEFAFAATHDIYIIGLSLSPDDFFVRSFFLSNLPYVAGSSGVKGRRVFIVNPDPKAAENYAFVLSRGYAELFCEPFGEKHVRLMKEGR